LKQVHQTVELAAIGQWSNIHGSLIYSAKPRYARTTESLAQFAIKGLIDLHAAEKNRKIDLVNFGVKNGRGEKVIEKILQLENLSLAMNISNDGRSFLYRSYINPCV
jgi:hypothetical protein